MSYHPMFDTTENKALIAICTRKMIRTIGIGAVIWGVINLGLGMYALQLSLLNIGLVALGALMLATGIRAMTSPSLNVLLTETILAALLFFWNLGVSILYFQAHGVAEPQGLIFPLVIAGMFFNYYRKLGHLREQIASVAPEKIKATKQMCKALVKKKLKDEPTVVQTTDRKCRAQLMDGSAFFIQRDLMRAFVASRDDLAGSMVKPDAARLKLQIEHPVGRIKYQFDKKNSAKLKSWLFPEEAAS